MTTTNSLWQSFRCRLGVHSWKDVACADGQFLRTCVACRKGLGPFAQYERQPPPREDPRSYPW